MKDTREQPRGRILTRPSRKFGLFGDFGSMEDVSSTGIASSFNGECREEGRIRPDKSVMIDCGVRAGAAGWYLDDPLLLLCWVVVVVVVVVISKRCNRTASRPS